MSPNGAFLFLLPTYMSWPSLPLDAKDVAKKASRKKLSKKKSKKAKPTGRSKSRVKKSKSPKPRKAKR